MASARSAATQSSVGWMASELYDTKDIRDQLAELDRHKRYRETWLEKNADLAPQVSQEDIDFTKIVCIPDLEHDIQFLKDRLSYLKEYEGLADQSKSLLDKELAKSSFANEVHDFVPLETPYSTIPADLEKIDEHREVLSKICEDLFGTALRPATEKELEEALVAHARVQNELSQTMVVDDNGGRVGNVASGEPTLHPSEHPNSPVPVPVPSTQSAVVPMFEDGGDAVS